MSTRISELFLSVIERTNLSIHERSELDEGDLDYDEDFIMERRKWYLNILKIEYMLVMCLIGPTFWLMATGTTVSFLGFLLFCSIFWSKNAFMYLIPELVFKSDMLYFSLMWMEYAQVSLMATENSTFICAMYAILLLNLRLPLFCKKENRLFITLLFVVMTIALYVVKHVGLQVYFPLHGMFEFDQMGHHICFRFVGNIWFMFQGTFDIFIYVVWKMDHKRLLLLHSQKIQKKETSLKSLSKRFSETMLNYFTGIVLSLSSMVDVTNNIGHHALLTKKEIGYLNDAKFFSNACIEQVESVSGFDSLQEGNLDVKSEDFDPSSLLTRVIETKRHQLALSKKSSLTIDDSFVMYNSFPDVLQGDVGLIYQVYNNITSNAIKYSDTGVIKIESLYDTFSRTLIFKCKDEGIGIKNEKIAKIGRPFEKISDTVGRESFGLGLCITKRLVEGSMSGKIDFFSEGKKGKGTLVEVFLPLDYGDGGFYWSRMWSRPTGRTERGKNFRPPNFASKPPPTAKLEEEQEQEQQQEEEEEEEEEEEQEEEEQEEQEQEEEEEDQFEFEVEGEEEEEQEQEEQQEEEQVSNSPLKIMIIDKNEVCYSSLVLYIRNMNPYTEIRTFISGSVAFQEILKKNFEPDLFFVEEIDEVWNALSFFRRVHNLPRYRKMNHNHNNNNNIHQEEKNNFYVLATDNISYKGCEKNEIIRDILKKPVNNKKVTKILLEAISRKKKKEQKQEEDNNFNKAFSYGDSWMKIIDGHNFPQKRREKNNIEGLIRRRASVFCDPRRVSPFSSISNNIRRERKKSCQLPLPMKRQQQQQHIFNQQQQQNEEKENSDETSTSSSSGRKNGEDSVSKKRSTEFIHRCRKFLNLFIRRIMIPALFGIFLWVFDSHLESYLGDDEVEGEEEEKSFRRRFDYKLVFFFAGLDAITSFFFEVVWELEKVQKVDIVQLFVIFTFCCLQNTITPNLLSSIIVCGINVKSGREYFNECKIILLVFFLLELIFLVMKASVEIPFFTNLFSRPFHPPELVHGEFICNTFLLLHSLYWVYLLLKKKEEVEEEMEKSNTELYSFLYRRKIFLSRISHELRSPISAFFFYFNDNFGNSYKKNKNINFDEFYRLIKRYSYDINKDISNLFVVCQYENKRMRLVKSNKKFLILQSFKELMEEQYNYIKTTTTFVNIILKKKKKKKKKKKEEEEEEEVNYTINNNKKKKKKKKMTIIHHFDEKSMKNLKVGMDWSSLRNIIRNIISNAIKYSSSSSSTSNRIIIESRITTETNEEGVNYNLFHFSVQDNGIGMTEKQIKELFLLDRSSTTETTETTSLNKPKKNNKKFTASKSVSLRLGMFCSFQLCKLLNGKIKVKSEGFGKGTKINIKIPIYDFEKTEQQQQQQQEEEEEEEEEGEGDLDDDDDGGSEEEEMDLMKKKKKNKKIFYLDDNPILPVIFRKCLLIVGFADENIFTANSEEEGLEIYEQHGPFDFSFCDFNLENWKVDRFYREVDEKMKKKKKEVHGCYNNNNNNICDGNRIVVTGGDNVFEKLSDEVRKSLGIVSVIYKPFTLADVENVFM